MVTDEKKDVSGEAISGVITRILGSSISMSYELSVGDAIIELEWNGALTIGDCVVAKGKFEEGVYLAESLTRVEEEIERKRIISKLEKKASVKAGKAKANFLIDDAAMKRMKKKIEEGAERIKAAALMGRAILVRFNNDADGITGGVAITTLCKPAKVRSIIHPSAVYLEKDALRDIGVLGQQFKPLLILVDFGANAESVQALAIVKEAGFDIFIIDHHPPDEKAVALLDYFVSPWAFEAGSEYAAGFLSSEVAKAGGCDEAFMNDLAKISLAGDRSKLLVPSAESERKALVMDYLAVVREAKGTADFFEGVLRDIEEMAILYEVASEKLETATVSALKDVKEKKYPKLLLVTFDLDKFCTSKEFPAKGKLAGSVFDLYAKGGKSVVVLGTGERVFNFRVSPAAHKAGFNAAKIIEELKAEFTDAIESGGGHQVAASIRVKKGYDKIMFDALMKKIEQVGW